ncbi:MAG: reductive dehalogenase [Candidatus Thorarchaeota archaeon]
MGLYVIREVCKPNECELECLVACTQVHGERSPLKALQRGEPPVIDAARCTECLACVRACPLGAVTTSVSQSLLASSSPQSVQHSDHPKSHRALDLEGRPYEVSEDFTQFHESKTIFARAVYDTSFVHYQHNEYWGAERMISKHIPEYERYGSELGAAAWEIHDLLRNRHEYIERARKELRAKRKRPRLDPEALTRMIKRTARFFGASLVGISELDRRWLYTADRRDQLYDVPEEIDHVVVMAIEMDYDAIASSPGFTASAEVARCYSVMTFIETELAAFIRRLGYSAIPCGNDVGLSVPVAIDAGLGQYGRHGLLITKEFGSRVRIAKVLTDMPLVPDKPDLKFCSSVVKFCEVCEKCARTCPSQSIAYGKERTWQGKTISNNPGIKKWYINPETCYGFWMANGADCSNCLRSCPYNKPNNIFHKFIVWLTMNFPWLDRLIVKMDDLAGFGKQRGSSKFWKKIER